MSRSSDQQSKLRELQRDLLAIADEVRNNSLDDLYPGMIDHVAIAQYIFMVAWLRKPENNISEQDLNQVILSSLNLSKEFEFVIKQTWYDKQEILSAQELRKELIATRKRQQELAEDEHHLNHLKTQLRSNPGLYSVDSVANWIAIQRPTIVNLESFSKFYQEIYSNKPNERIAFLNACIERGILNKNHTSQVKAMMSYVEDDKAVANFLNSYQKVCRISNGEVFRILENRTGEKFSNIHEILKGKTVGESVSPKKLAELEKEIPGVSNQNLSQLFAYYSIKKSPKEFAALLKYETKVQIKDDFAALDQKPLFKKDEYENLKLLVSDLNLPRVKILCDLFKDKIKYPASLSNNSLTFQDGLILPTTKSSNQTILQFFKTIIGGEENFRQISGREKGKLVRFFKESRREIATVLLQDKGAETLSSLIFTAADGCSKNIGTQIRLAVSQALLKNESVEDQILFRVFNSEIIIPVLNQGGDVIYLTQNPFEIKPLRESAINKKGLMAAIGKEVGKEEVTSILRGNFGDEETVDIFNTGEQNTAALGCISKKIDLYLQCGLLNQKISELCGAGKSNIPCFRITTKGNEVTLKINKDNSADAIPDFTRTEKTKPNVAAFDSLMKKSRKDFVQEIADALTKNGVPHDITPRSRFSSNRNVAPVVGGVTHEINDRKQSVSLTFPKEKFERVLKALENTMLKGSNRDQSR